MYSIAYGRTREHAEELRSGLATLSTGFLARICPLCDGEGQRRQHYNIGCGQGMTTMVGRCDYCDGTGLMQGSKPAPVSVREQVLNAARRVCD
jgi:DnaJ-class molecular chaperone